jgi:DNA-binding FrmR family transcriptional regulator
MTHTIRQKTKLLNRVSRLRGQVEAVERALSNDAECGEIMRLLSACRGAASSLLAEVMESHVREHVVAPRARRDGPQARAADELIDVVHSYFK